MKTPRERRSLNHEAAELRIADGAAGPILRGYAAKFNRDSEDLGGFREFIRPGAFTAAIEECDVRALVDHNPTLILGRNKAGTLRLSQDDIGLSFEVDLPDTQAARDLSTSIKRGDISGCSFGFIVVEDRWMTSDAGPKRELIRTHLFDVSAVTYPAYPDTEVALRSLDAFKASLTPSPVPTPLRDAAKRWLVRHAIR